VNVCDARAPIYSKRRVVSIYKANRKLSISYSREWKRNH